VAPLGLARRRLLRLLLDEGVAVARLLLGWVLEHIDGDEELPARS
jgi:hypothetical protein